MISSLSVNLRLSTCQHTAHTRRYAQILEIILESFMSDCSSAKHVSVQSIVNVSASAMMDGHLKIFHTAEQVLLAALSWPLRSFNPLISITS
jgi:hypothetical protein